jgi:hypothetical protein
MCLVLLGGHLLRHSFFLYQRREALMKMGDGRLHLFPPRLFLGQLSFERFHLANKLTALVFDPGESKSEEISLRLERGELHAEFTDITDEVVAGLLVDGCLGLEPGSIDLRGSVSSLVLQQTGLESPDLIGQDPKVLLMTFRFVYQHLDLLKEPAPFATRVGELLFSLEAIDLHFIKSAGQRL